MDAYSGQKSLNTLPDQQRSTSSLQPYQANEQLTKIRYRQLNPYLKKTHLTKPYSPQRL